MLKRKLGLSLVLALAMMLVFSAVALAAGVTGLNATSSNGKITVTWTKDVDPSTVKYEVTLKDGVEANNVIKVVPYTEAATIDFDITSVKAYTVEVKTVGGTNDNGVSTKAVTPGVVSGLKVTEENGKLYISWTRDGSETYKVTVLDAVTKEVIGTNSSATSSYSVAALKDKKYSIEVSTLNTFKVASAEYWIPPSNGTVTLTDEDNNLGNANYTGLNVTTNDGTTVTDVIKSDGMVNNVGDRDKTQRTHGEYQNNTNSCASCHQTHTAASENLLFKDGVFNTCTACHDGTLGFYNVFDNTTMGYSTAGTFGGTVAGNASVHLSTGAVTTSAAPGGDRTGTGVWAGEFNCASCHSAHGSYSDRLLNYNPNGMGEIASADGGIKADNVPVLDYANRKVQQEGQPKYIAVRGTTAQHDAEKSTTGSTVAYPTGAPSGTLIMIYQVAYNADGTVKSVTRTDNPWLFGTASRASAKDGLKAYYLASIFNDIRSNILNTKGQIPIAKAGVVVDYDDQGDHVKFNFAKGYVWSDDTSLNNAQYVEISRAYIVKLDLVQTGNYGGTPIFKVNEAALSAGKLSNPNDKENKFLAFKYTSDATKDVTGMGVALSAFCASCHTDYMNSAGSETGRFSTAYRHNTTSDSYNCVRCHFAHGTDVNIMKDAQGRTVKDLQSTVAAGGEGFSPEIATAYMLDKNPSSALKRYTNMSVCWGCHTSSHAEQLQNNDFFMTTGDVPHGLTDNIPTTAPAPTDITQFDTVKEDGTHTNP